MIILTGASGGLGRELIDYLAEIDNVIGLYNTRKPPASENPRITWEKLDLLDGAEIETFIDKKKNRLSKIALVHGAAISIDELAVNFEEEAWDRVMDINLKGNFLRNWCFGKWLLGGSIADHSSNQIYIYMTGILLSASMAGVLGAARNILGLANIILLGLDNWLNPTASIQFAKNGKGALNRLLVRVSIWGGAVIGAYCLVASLFSQVLLDLLYRNIYSGYGMIVTLFALQTIVIFSVRMPTYGIRAVRKPQYLFIGKLISALFALPATIFLVKHFGIYGACSGMILGQLIIFAALTLFYLKIINGISLAEVPT